MGLDYKKARNETPGCLNVLHFNNAGAALMPNVVIDAVNTYFLRESKIGGYEAAEEAHVEIEEFYHNAATLIGAYPEEIAYALNATRAWDMIFYSIPLKEGDRILTCQSEYASNYFRNGNKQADINPSNRYGKIKLRCFGSRHKNGLTRELKKLKRCK